MMKSIAVPARLQKDDLTEEEQEELKQYGHRPMSEAEIALANAEREAWEAGAEQRALDEWDRRIRADYAANSDPLIPQVMAGEKTQAEFAAARAEVKARNPKPRTENHAQE